MSARPSRDGGITSSQANKLSRIYATLLEALNPHRDKGQQKVTVEHVYVHEGGQSLEKCRDSPYLGPHSKPTREVVDVSHETIRPAIVVRVAVPASTRLQSIWMLKAHVRHEVTCVFNPLACIFEI